MTNEELEEASSLVLECAKKLGEIDAKNGVTVPPAEFCEDTKTSKTLRESWLHGWNSVSDKKDIE